MPGSAAVAAAGRSAHAPQQPKGCGGVRVAAPATPHGRKCPGDAGVCGGQRLPQEGPRDGHGCQQRGSSGSSGASGARGSPVASPHRILGASLQASTPRTMHGGLGKSSSGEAAAVPGCARAARAAGVARQRGDVERGASVRRGRTGQKETTRGREQQKRRRRGVVTAIQILRNRSNGRNTGSIFLTRRRFLLTRVIIRVRA
jgi:hypothetical protein